ncbi:MAG: hypothetical protein ACYCUI_04340 [Vulcanimicrobiaceae bacterium]
MPTPGYESHLYDTMRHCVFALHSHLVFVQKYRRHVPNKAILSAPGKGLRADLSFWDKDYRAVGAMVGGTG